MHAVTEQRQSRPVTVQQTWIEGRCTNGQAIRRVLPAQSQKSASWMLWNGGRSSEGIRRGGKGILRRVRQDKLSGERMTTTETPTSSTVTPSIGAHANVPFLEYAKWNAINWHTLKPFGFS